LVRTNDITKDFEGKENYSVINFPESQSNSQKSIIEDQNLTQLRFEIESRLNNLTASQLEEYIQLTEQEYFGTIQDSEIERGNRVLEWLDENYPETKLED
jgi:hypothetical protein